MIHGRARLLILSFLVRHPRSHRFTDLRDGLGMTDGSLSVNLSKLEAAGYVQISRDFVGRKPQTLVKLTPAGKRAFGRYLDDLRRLVPGLAD
ncbi:transcriptional regulator [bacterium]|nr:transcriptional regulator [bacterium]